MKLLLCMYLWNHTSSESKEPLFEVCVSMLQSTPFAVLFILA